MYQVNILPQNQMISAAAGSNLMNVLRNAGLYVDAPCGGNGSCGKCKVLVDGVQALACQSVVDRDMTVTLPATQAASILTAGISAHTPVSASGDSFHLAFDIGTTTIAGYLLDGNTELACASARNPHVSFGGDVISRIQHARKGHMAQLTESVRTCVQTLAGTLCSSAGIEPGLIGMVSIVGNPAMQQFFLGIPPDNLAQIPFTPVLTHAKLENAAQYLPACHNAALLIVPDISGFVGADTVAGILATGLAERESYALLVDIGTNGEMVLGNRHRMVACSAAAGPAFEGAGISCGMRGQIGAIDHVWLQGGTLRYSVIGGGVARGICGSGLIDAVAVALEQGLLNDRGKILTADGLIHLTADISLTQEDIRQVQLAKGAIAAGIHLMTAHSNITLHHIHCVYLAGAFGTYMDPKNACRIGLLPKELEDRIIAVGNAAGSGAKILACSPDRLALSQKIVETAQALELSTLPGFSRCFAKNMRF